MMKKSILTMSGSCMIALIFLLLDVRTVYWDGFFLFGLVIFMVGGVLLLLKKGIFDFFFYSFKKFLKSSSKVEQYVSEVNDQQEFATSSSKNASIPSAILFTGISIIIVTTVFPVYLL
ncbi:DUF3899 domain-containing protein [Sporosarcina aquimarina]|uniref:DUF3899 domain-containing protein n=1 Tax=Sporosarcina aquimarina TaxID=114975 RepID=A0ABU4G322_9BACL|nr:DUF3899 domain-containing protein [Sporosarcina aquimarina]MDW0110708.1 DUF3899 domain-containing protein [Sporosarcina aquimarina]